MVYNLEVNIRGEKERETSLRCDYYHPAVMRPQSQGKVQLAFEFTYSVVYPKVRKHIEILSCELRLRCT